MNEDNVVHLDTAGMMKLKLLSNYEHKAACEDTGYNLGPELCKRRNFTPEMMLLSVLMYLEADLDVDDPGFDINKTLAELYGTLGLIRWCVDQRGRKH